MKKGEYQGEQNPASEESMPLEEGPLAFNMDEVRREFLAAEKLIPERASLQPEFDNTGEIKTVTIRDNETGKIIFFSDLEFFRKDLEDKKRKAQEDEN